MRARDLMTTSLVTVRPSTSIKEAADLLVRHGFTTLPVVGVGGGLVGVVTDVDIPHGRHGAHPDWPVRLVNGAAPPMVGTVMTHEVVVLGPTADAAEIAHFMLDYHLRAIPIVDDADRLVGIVTRRDLLRTIARDDKAITNDVRHHLESAFRRGDWSATVDEGVVTLVDECGDESDRRIATILAGAVPGVIDVRVVTPAVTTD